MKRNSGQGRSSRLGVLLSATALLVVPGVAGCSYVSPNTTATTYAAADGTNGSITDPNSGAAVQLRNFLVVGTEKGAAGTLVGAVVNQGTSSVTVDLTVLDAAGQASVGTGSVTVEPGELAKVGGTDGAKVSLGSLPTAPGSVLKLQARTGAGTATVSLPVVAAQGHYASLKP